MGLPEHTPFKVVTDAHARILLADGAKAVPAAQTEFGKQVAALVGSARD